MQVAFIIIGIVVLAFLVLLAASSVPSVRRWVGRVAPGSLARRDSLVSALSGLLNLSPGQLAWLSLMVGVAGLGFGIYSAVGLPGWDDGDGTTLSPAEYGEKLNLTICDFERASEEASRDVQRAREDFESNPRELVGTYIGEVAKFSDGENPRVNRALVGLKDLSDDGPPSKFRADHDNFVAVLKPYQAAISLIDERVPENAEQLSDLELLEIIAPDFDEIWRLVLATQAARSQAVYSEEFNKIKSCEIEPRTPSS